MYKELFKNFDKIKVSESDVSKAVDYAVNTIVKESETEKNGYKGRRLLPLIAACLVLVFAGTMILGLHRFGGDKSTSDEFIPNQTAYSFIVRANSQKSQSGAAIGVYSGTNTGGWSMYEKYEKYKDFSPNFFQSYGFSYFVIEGKNIKSVTFNTDVQGVYFAVSPAGYSMTFDEDTFSRIYAEESKNYTEMSLENSQYTASQLKQYSDGLSYGDIYCDTFKFVNSDRSDEISFSNKLELVIESNHNNNEVSGMLDKIWKCEQELLEIRSQRTFESGELSEREETLYKEIDLLSQNIRKLVLQDGVMTVLVEFENGTTQEKTFELGLEYMEDQGLWLTVSECE